MEDHGIYEEGKDVRKTRKRFLVLKIAYVARPRRVSEIIAQKLPGGGISQTEKCVHVLDF